MSRLAVAMAGIVGFSILGSLFAAYSVESGQAAASLVGGTAGALLGILLAASVDSIRRLSGSSLLLVAGLFALFIGERILLAGTTRTLASGVGLLIVFGSIGLRALVMARSEGRLRDAHRLAIVSSGAVVVGLLLYATTLESVVTSLFSDEEAITRWQGAIGAIWPILVLCGTLPVAALDWVISLHPRMIPPKIAREAALQALSAGLAVALVFPVNYLASKYEQEKDVAYFRTTRAGAATLGAVGSLSEKVEVTLFYPAGSDVARELVPYFDSLEQASGGMLAYTQVDQALVPAVAEELKIRDNGFVVFRAGESTEKFALDDDLDKAKRKLKKLDESVQKSLLKVARGQRVGYFVTGHGEGNFRQQDNPLRKLNLFKKVLETQNMKLSNLGATEGLANQVPDDADLVILAGPEFPLLPEETQSLLRYVDGGGKLFVMADPGGDPMPELMDRFGLTVGEFPLAHATSHLRQTTGVADRILLVTNRYGSHTAVKTLSKAGTTSPLMVPTVVSVEKRDDAPGKVNALVRSFPDTWPDANNNREQDAGEVGKVWDIAMASEGPEIEGKEGWRAVVIGDVNWAADPLLQHSQANQIFAVDVVRWMLGEEALIGETTNEEDVKIQHTRDDDWVWFYLTVIGAPLLVFGVGMVRIRLRRSR